MNLSKAKIGVVGCGKQAPKHISGYIACGVKPENILVADVNADAANNVAKKTGATVKELDDILNDNSVLAISICTPVKFHKPIIIQSIEAGKHFFCEKPLTDNVEDDKVIQSMTNKHNLVGNIGYIYRFAPALKFIKDRLHVTQNGNSYGDDIGQIHSAIFRISGKGSHSAWKHKKASGGGALNEMAVHMMDLSLWYFGKMKHHEMVSSDLLQAVRVIDGGQMTCDIDDTVVLKLKSHTGVDITILADMNTPVFKQSVEIVGENGIYEGSINPQYDSKIVTTTKGVKETPIEVEQSNIFVDQINSFLESIETASFDNQSLEDNIFLGSMLSDFQNR